MRAALNAAFKASRKRLPSTLPAAIKAGLAADGAADEDGGGSPARDNQILTDRQVTSLIAAARVVDVEDGWEGDLFRIVVVLAASGTRFGQAARMKVLNVQRAQSRLFIPSSRKGKGQKVEGVAVAVGADVMEALLPATMGRPTGAPLLERWRYVQIALTAWKRDRRGPWQVSAELTRAWTKVRDQAGMPGIISYALRHSSIVRGIRANLPIRLVASLHDTSVAMIERHYARYIADGLDELAARAVVPLVPSEGGNVVQLKGIRA
jgi:integrase